MIELVDFNTVYNKEEKTTATKKTRRSRGAATATTQKSETAPVAASGDDLVKIEGIGPKIAEALNAAGITTFATLATKTAEEVKEILEAAEGNFNLADATTWAQQAQLAADGKWDELQTLQDELKGGKEA
nr:DUF4332 domain-containing protein [Taibaiella sp. KBW10]